MIRIFFIFFLVSCYSFSQSRFKNIQLPKPKKVSYRYSQCEPSIAINTNSPNELIAGSIVSDYYYSLDTGYTWQSSTLKSKFGVWGDPVMLFDKTGAAYYFHLAQYGKTFIDRIVCQRASSPSAKFSTGTFPKPNGTKSQDKHWVAYDHKRDIIYLTWTQFDAYNSSDTKDSSVILFSKSINHGETWSEPKRISKFAGDCVDSDNTVEGAVPTVGLNGELFVSWSGPKGLVFQKSMDLGETWLSEEQFISKQIGGWDITVPGINRCNGMPIMCSDTSTNQYRGRIYLNWADQSNGLDDTDVFLKYSDDQGVTWSNPIRVNQDKTKSHQFFTWFTVDQVTGYVYVVYFDRRNYSDLNTDVYLSVSKDGGETFEDIRISESPFIPDAKIFIGDYNNITAFNGIVRPIWPRMDAGKISLWTALIQIK